MTTIIGFILVASFIFAISCGVILLVRLGEFLISYYGPIIFVVPFAVSITLIVLLVIFYVIGQKKKKKRDDAISKLKEISEALEKHKPTIYNDRSNIEKECGWIRKNNGEWFECSNCGARNPKDYYGSSVISAYCPECGKKMGTIMEDKK